MEIRQLKQRSDKYFTEKEPHLVTLAGLTRSLRLEEGDIEKILDEKSGRQAMMDIYLRLAEVLEEQAIHKSNTTRNDMLKAINKFVGGLYSFDEIAGTQFINARKSFNSIDSGTQKKLMESIANRKRE